MEKFLVLKIKNPEKLNIQEIIKKVTGDWKIKPHNLYDVDKIIVLQQLHCIAVLKMGDKIIYTKSNQRITFENLEEIKNHKFLNKKFDYNTGNPATIAEESKLEKLIL